MPAWGVPPSCQTLGKFSSAALVGGRVQEAFPSALGFPLPPSQCGGGCPGGFSQRRHPVSPEAPGDLRDTRDEVCVGIGRMEPPGSGIWAVGRVEDEPIRHTDSTGWGSAEPETLKHLGWGVSSLPALEEAVTRVCPPLGAAWPVNWGLITGERSSLPCPWLPRAMQGLGGMWLAGGTDTSLLSPQYSPSMRATYLSVTDEHVRPQGSEFPA